MKSMNFTEIALGCISEYVNRSCPSITKEELKNTISLLANIIVRLDSELKVSESNLIAAKNIINELESSQTPLLSLNSYVNKTLQLK
jgi:hypothetical protein